MRKMAASSGLAGIDAQLMLERQPQQAGGDARQDDQPGELLGWRLDPPPGESPRPGRDNKHPVAREKDQNAESAAHVEHDHEAEPVRLWLRLGDNQGVPPE